MEDYEEEMMSPEEFNRRLNAVHNSVKLNSILCGIIVGAIGVVVSYIAAEFFL